MKVVQDWKRILLFSISQWMQYAGLIALVVPEFRYYVTGQDYNPVLFWWVSVLLLVAGLIGRLVKQGVSVWREWLRLGVIVAVIVMLALLLSSKVHAAPYTDDEMLSVAVPFIAEQEGEETTAYLDIVGVPTICSGSTRGVTLGMTMTVAQCRALLKSEVIEYREGLHRYFTATTINHRMTPERDTAYTSLAFNVGISGAGKSTATRRLNAGNIAGGCTALTWWNKAGGRVIRGLVSRRKREYALCMLGL